MTFDAFVDWQTYRLRHGFDKPVQRLSVRPRVDGHGTLKSYQHHGCRCGRCKAANAERAKRSRDLWRARAQAHADRRFAESQARHVA